MVNIMGDDVLIFTMLNRINSVPARTLKVNLAWRPLYIYVYIFMVDVILPTIKYTLRI